MTFLIQMSQFILIDMKNPHVKNHVKLREILILRRKCHKLFDRIKCGKFLELLEEAQSKFFDTCQDSETEKSLQ